MRSFLRRIAATAGTLLVVGCTRVALFLANAPAAFGSYDRIAGLTYGDGPRARLDLYVPNPATPTAHTSSAMRPAGAPAAALPVIAFWYGGSWTNGNRADYRFVGAAPFCGKTCSRTS